jgi:hypothetical protein
MKKTAKRQSGRKAAGKKPRSPAVVLTDDYYEALKSNLRRKKLNTDKVQILLNLNTKLFDKIRKYAQKRGEVISKVVESAVGTFLKRRPGK